MGISAKVSEEACCRAGSKVAIDAFRATQEIAQSNPSRKVARRKLVHHFLKLFDFFVTGSGLAVNRLANKAVVPNRFLYFVKVLSKQFDPGLDFSEVADGFLIA